mmetsp:Transcript_92222/g.245015  ORF Transcript_92222/g.245015 Transcript_92222/m.245015 type:complete len:103 (-) Transcript_92222:523-831(-)
MTKQVHERLESTSSSAVWTSCSERMSRAEVASSRTSTRGRRASARAMQTRCFWPPLNARPRSPAGVSRPWGSEEANSFTWAARTASSTAAALSASSSTPSRP